LQTRFDIDDRSRQVLVPNLLLQPIFENAIKFAVSENLGPTQITLTAQMENSDLVLSVTDNGPGMTLDDTSSENLGIGLSNVRQRLDSTFGERSVLTLQKAEPTGLALQIRLRDAVCLKPSAP
jgi:LytS/YehU family sensor histidine kinase